MKIDSEYIQKFFEAVKSQKLIQGNFTISVVFFLLEVLLLKSISVSG